MWGHGRVSRMRKALIGCEKIFQVTELLGNPQTTCYTGDAVPCCCSINSCLCACAQVSTKFGQLKDVNVCQFVEVPRRQWRPIRRLEVED